MESWGNGMHKILNYFDVRNFYGRIYCLGLACNNQQFG